MKHNLPYQFWSHMITFYKIKVPSRHIDDSFNNTHKDGGWGSNSKEKEEAFTCFTLCFYQFQSLQSHGFF